MAGDHATDAAGVSAVSFTVNSRHLRLPAKTSYNRTKVPVLEAAHATAVGFGPAGYWLGWAD